MQPQILLVNLKSAENLKKWNFKSDPFLYVAVITATTEADGGPSTIPKSLYKTKYVEKTTGATWNEQALACNVTMEDWLVLTVADHDGEKGRDYFLGQVNLRSLCCPVLSFPFASFPFLPCLPFPFFVARNGLQCYAVPCCAMLCHCMMRHAFMPCRTIPYCVVSSYDMPGI